MTAREITIAIYSHFLASSDLMIPRYTPIDWWECDVWRLTKSGYVDEFEIKLSVSDFKADASKAKDKRERFDRETRTWIVVEEKKKHELLEYGNGGPNRFWFVISEQISGLVEIPEWAGLIVARKRSYGCHLVVEKAAPKRHSAKWEGDRLAIMKTFYYRFWTLECARPKAFNELIAL